MKFNRFQNNDNFVQVREQTDKTCLLEAVKEREGGKEVFIDPLTEQ